jgi:hypothetical protein
MKRTIRNQTFIYIRQTTNNLVVVQIDCKYSPDVYFLNMTLVFFVRSPPWIIGMTYYVQVTEGVVTADRFCGTEAGGFGKLLSNLFRLMNELFDRVKVAIFGDLPSGIQRYRQPLLNQLRHSISLSAR